MRSVSSCCSSSNMAATRSCRYRLRLRASCLATRAEISTVCASRISPLNVSSRCSSCLIASVSPSRSMMILSVLSAEVLPLTARITTAQHCTFQLPHFDRGQQSLLQQGFEAQHAVRRCEVMIKNAAHASTQFVGLAVGVALGCGRGEEAAALSGGHSCGYLTGL